MTTNVIVMKIALTLLALPPFLPPDSPYLPFMNLSATLGSTPHLPFEPCAPSTFDLWPLSQATPISPAHLCMRRRTLLHCFYYSIWSLLGQPFDPAPTLMSSRQCDATSWIGWCQGIRMMCGCLGVDAEAKKRVRGKMWGCVCVFVNSPTAALPGWHHACQPTNCRMQKAMQVWHASVPGVCTVPALEKRRKKLTDLYMI